MGTGIPTTATCKRTDIPTTASCIRSEGDQVETQVETQFEITAKSEKHIEELKEIMSKHDSAMEGVLLVCSINDESDNLLPPISTDRTSDNNGKNDSDNSLLPFSTDSDNNKSQPKKKLLK
jgi:hypothetical protein